MKYELFRPIRSPKAAKFVKLTPQSLGADDGVKGRNRSSPKIIMMIIFSTKIGLINLTSVARCFYKKMYKKTTKTTFTT